MPAPKPVTLCILDGWGLRAETAGNAVAQAHTPGFDELMSNHPHTQLAAHGPDVGLPVGQMGNSEVGHMNIGAGRIVWMDLPRIDNAIQSGEFAENPALNKLIARLQASGGTAHLAALISPGGVHAHQNQVAAAANVIAASGVPVAIHAFADGRDVAPQSAKTYFAEFEEMLPEGAAIHTLIGRFYAMDRDNRWERVAAAVGLILRGEGAEAADVASAITAAYTNGDTDEFIPATRLLAYTAPKDGDGLLFLNFRADRARQVLAALAAPSFDAFETGPRPVWADVCGLVEYSEAHNAYMSAMFPAIPIVNTLGQWVTAHGKTQFRLAETEKYPHVTFFMNGGVEEPDKGETRYMAPSPKVRTYDLQPEMSAGEVADQLEAAIKTQGYDLIIVNFANPDMVGHTGILPAAIAACEAVDQGLMRAMEATKAVGGVMLVTADHGNCEMMIDPETGGPHTAHTLNPVPLALFNAAPGMRLRAGGKLGDLAPTLLALMGLPQPAEMTGESLLTR
jgi:2,3-bisphosphoglycerate-independent phosphoglycerate mutase